MRMLRVGVVLALVGAGVAVGCGGIVRDGVDDDSTGSSSGGTGGSSGANVTGSSGGSSGGQMIGNLLGSDDAGMPNDDQPDAGGCIPVVYGPYSFTVTPLPHGTFCDVSPSSGTFDLEPDSGVPNVPANCLCTDPTWMGALKCSASRTVGGVTITTTAELSYGRDNLGAVVNVVSTEPDGGVMTCAYEVSGVAE
jgi:hypothetical protein